jgi:hypothetical protein
LAGMDGRALTGVVVIGDWAGKSPISHIQLP